MIHMLFAAKRTGSVERHLRIQGLVTGLVGYDTPVIKDFEIRTFKSFVLTEVSEINAASSREPLSGVGLSRCRV